MRAASIWLVSFLDAILLGRTYAQSVAYAQRQVRAWHLCPAKVERTKSHDER